MGPKHPQTTFMHSWVKKKLRAKKFTFHPLKISGVNFFAFSALGKIGVPRRPYRPQFLPFFSKMSKFSEFLYASFESP